MVRLDGGRPSDGWVTVGEDTVPTPSAYDRAMSDEEGSPPPSAPKQLDRAPGERYRARPTEPTAPGVQAAATGSSPAVRAAAPFVVAAVGALLIAVLGSFDIGAGLLAVSGFIGWAVGVSIVWGGVPGGGARGRRGWWSAGLAAASIVAGFVLLWVWSHVEGGVLDPFAYLDERFGPIAYLNIVVAAAVAWLRAH